MKLLAESEPVKNLTVKIRVPAGTKLNYKVNNTKTEVLRSDQEGNTLYSWQFENVPAIPAEENQKGGYDLFPRLVFSTANDRESIYSGFLEPASANTGGEKTKPDPAMKKMVDDILKDSKDEISTILKLQEKGINEFRLWPIPMKYTGFHPRSPEETWKSNGGTLLEKALLLVTMLNIAGIPAEPALVIRKSLYDEKVGGLLDIEDIVVKVKPKTTNELYLSVSSLNPQNLLTGLPERVIVALNPGENPRQSRVKISA